MNTYTYKYTYTYLLAGLCSIIGLIIIICFAAKKIYTSINNKFDFLKSDIAKLRRQVKNLEKKCIHK